MQADVDAKHATHRAATAQIKAAKCHLQEVKSRTLAHKANTEELEAVLAILPLVAQADEVVRGEIRTSVQVSGSARRPDSTRSTETYALANASTCDAQYLERCQC